MSKSKYIYVEPKAELCFAEQPRERNTYRIEDTTENRKALRCLEGSERVKWLEEHEAR